MAGVLKPSPGALRIIDDLEGGLAIVVNGDTAPKNIAAGQYLFIKNHSTLATGGYHATAAISSGGTISSSNVAADADGIANSLNSNKMNDVVRVVKTYENITVSSTGYIEIDTYNGLEIENTYRCISAMVRGWASASHPITIIKGSGGDRFFIMSEPQTISSVTVEYYFYKAN